jgi:hypothetical protein
MTFKKKTQESNIGFEKYAINAHDEVFKIVGIVKE